MKAEVREQRSEISGTPRGSLCRHPSSDLRPPTSDLWRTRFLDRVLAQDRAPFRGGAVENLGGAPMGKGHGNDGQPFDIETACYLKPIFARYDAARRNRQRLFLVLKAGVKTIKSFTGEVCAGEHVCHARGDAAIFFGSEAAAESTATTRILDFFRGIPNFQRKLATIRSRFDETMGALKFPDKTLFILSANLSNTQQKNLAFVLLQDAFVTGNSGMIEEMLARTTQYEKECVIILESQGGEKGFDFDRHYDGSSQEELHVTCPCCGVSHLWNWKAFDMTRPEDFEATLPAQTVKEIEDRFYANYANERELKTGGEKGSEFAEIREIRVNPFSAAGHALGMEIAWARQELTATLKAENRRRCGFKRGPDELIKFEDGSYNEAAVMRETYFECYHCGEAWRDDGDFGATRIALDRSSHYVAANPQALWCNVGFNVPQWINRRLSWGKIMLEKLKAQKLAAEFGNYGPLMRWWQKTAARTWDEDELKRNREVALNVGSYETDPEKLMPDFHSRDMAVDCQKKLGPDGLPVEEDVVGSFWWIIREFDKHGNSRQLARGFAESWEEWIAEQKRWKVPNTRVVIDSSKWTPSIMMKAAMEFEMVTPALPHPLTNRRDPYASCWRLFFGDKRAEFRVQGQLRNVSEGNATAPFTVSDKNGRRFPVRLFKYRWSNLAFEKQLDAIMERTPGMPKWETLPRESLPARIQNKETGILTFEQQLSARYKTTVRGADKYEDIAGREAHYRDCELMLLARASQDGLLGHVHEDSPQRRGDAERVGT